MLPMPVSSFQKTKKCNPHIPVSGWAAYIFIFPRKGSIGTT